MAEFDEQNPPFFFGGLRAEALVKILRIELFKYKLLAQIKTDEGQPSFDDTYKCSSYNFKTLELI